MKMRYVLKKLLFLLSATGAAHVGTMRVDFRAGCKQCQVNTTREETTVGKHLQEFRFVSVRSFFVCVLWRGVEKFR